MRLHRWLPEWFRQLLAAPGQSPGSGPCLPIGWRPAAKGACRRGWRRLPGNLGKLPPLGRSGSEIPGAAWGWLGRCRALESFPIVRPPSLRAVLFLPPSRRCRHGITLALLAAPLLGACGSVDQKALHRLACQHASGSLDMASVNQLDALRKALGLAPDLDPIAYCRSLGVAMEAGGPHDQKEPPPGAER